MERVTRAEAARRLNINRSTLTRWIDKHPALLDNDGLVDPVELQKHRDAVANPKLQTRGNPARLDSGAETGTEAGGEAAPRTPATARGSSSLNDHRARGEAAKAITAELDLADRLKLTLVRADVEAQIASAGELIKRKADEMAKDLAEKLARIDDPRAVEQMLRTGLRRMLDQASGALILAMSPRDEDGDTDAA